MTSLLSNCSRTLLFALAIPAFAGSSAHGIKNFHQLNEHVYRGAQPTDEGFQYLAQIGVKTVIDLREADERSQSEEGVVTAAGMKYVNVPMTGLTPPSESEISKILGILENDNTGPAFVHCQRGADQIVGPGRGFPERRHRVADQVLDHEAKDPGPGIDRGQDEQRFEQDGEMVPDPHQGLAAEE